HNRPRNYAACPPGRPAGRPIQAKKQARIGNSPASRMLTMRHFAHCLILLLVPVAAQASDALGGTGQSGCSYAPAEVERVAVPAASMNIANSAPAAPPAKAKPTQT